MNSRLFLMAIAVIAAFGIAATVVGPVTIATPVLAQRNMTGGNMTTAAWQASSKYPFLFSI
jgi:hypothetical protein